MSNSTVRLYDLLKTEYPTATYLGQIDQSVDLKSVNGIVLLMEVSESTSPNKDDAKRDQIVYNINVIGTLQKTVDAICENIRDLVEPYTDEYIMRMVYDSSAKEFDEDAEIYEKVMQFTCWPQKAGLNIPGGYWEHIVRFYNTTQFEVLNATALNYMAIGWTSYDKPTTHNFNADHTYADNAIQIYAMMSMDTELESGIKYTSTGGILTMYKEGFGNEWRDQTFLIRVRKDVPGNFLTE